MGIRCNYESLYAILCNVDIVHVVLSKSSIIMFYSTDNRELRLIREVSARNTSPVRDQAFS
jgi:hypothetical protein